MNINQVVEFVEIVRDDRGKDIIFVKLEHGSLRVAIATDDQCCEAFGYFDENELYELTNMAGTTLKSVHHIDTLLEGHTMPHNPNPDERAGHCLFVKFVTSIDTFVVGVYNIHNGYYGHQVNTVYNPDVQTLQDLV